MKQCRGYLEIDVAQPVKLKSAVEAVSVLIRVSLMGTRIRRILCATFKMCSREKSKFSISFGHKSLVTAPDKPYGQLFCQSF